MMTWRYEDIIRLARQLVKPGDLIVRNTILNLLSGSEKVDESYWAHQFPFEKGGIKIVSPTRTVFLPLRSQRPQLKIKFDFPRCANDDMLTNIMSYCKEYDDHAQIVVHNKSGRLCVLRFLESKEMLHLLTDTVACDEKERNFLADVLLEKSLDGRNFISDFTEPLSPEAVGFYLAIEVLLPWCLRDQLNGMIDAKATNLQIAKAFLVPEFVIRHIRNTMFGGKSYLGVSYEMNRWYDAS